MSPLIKKFITAFVIALLVFALSATVIGLALTIGREDEYKPPVTEGGKLWGESFNVLLVLTDYTPDKYSDYDPESAKTIFGSTINSEAPDTLEGYRRINAEGMALIRFDKERRELTYTCIPGNTLVSVKGVKLRICDVLENDGVETLVAKVNAMTGIEIDSYIIFTPESAADALDKVGEIIYTVPRDMVMSDGDVNINIEAGSQKLNGKKAVEMLRYISLEPIGTEAVGGYIKRFVNKLSEDFTYDEISGIINSIIDMSEVAVGAELKLENIELISESSKLEVSELPLWGRWQTVGPDRYFIIDEEKTLERFEPYRKINTPVDIWN